MTERKKTVFLLGAGASAGIIPIVKQFYSAGEELINYLHQLRADIRIGRIEHTPHIQEMRARTKTDTNDAIDSFSMKIRNLINDSKGYASIDTYAKRLFINSSKELEYTKIHLGALISCFENIGIPLHKKKAISTKTSFENDFERSNETRYDSLFATIIKDKSKRIPPDYSIISWNYDNQVELALLDYFEKLRNDANKLPINRINKNNAPKQTDLKGFNLVKINGTASLKDTEGIFTKKGKSIPYTIKYYRPNYTTIQNNNSHILTIIYSALMAEKGFFKSDISFAWETRNKILEFANHLFTYTDNLVIIGYSFPYFNQEVDHQLFKSIYEHNLPCNIYIQDPRFLEIRDRLSSIISNDSNNIVEKVTGDQFFMPY